MHCGPVCGNPRAGRAGLYRGCRREFACDPRRYLQSAELDGNHHRCRQQCGECDLHFGIEQRHRGVCHTNERRVGHRAPDASQDHRVVASRSDRSLAHADEARALESIAEQLQAPADEYKVNIVVLETHGRGGFKRLLLESVAEAFLRLFNRPILVVPEKPHEDE